VKLKEAYNYGRYFPTSKAETSEDLEKVSGHLNHLRNKERDSIGNVSILLHSMIKLEARENWLKNARVRNNWNDDYKAYLEYEVKAMFIDDFVDTYADHLKQLLQSYKF